MQISSKWLPLDIAATRLGYAHKESLTRRLRQLRRHGHVIDVGRPPVAYRESSPGAEAANVLMWPNPKIALLREDMPQTLLRAKRGRPTI